MHLRLWFDHLEDRLAPATLGLDVSAYQGAIDWSAVHAADGGQAFAIIKASQGTSSSVGAAYFSTNAAEAISAGMVVGAYHFADPEANQSLAADPSNTAELRADADAEADYFAQVAGRYLTSGNLQPALDLESAGFNNSFTPQEIATWATEWIAQLRRDAPGVQLIPFLYTDQDFAENRVASTLTSNPLWIAAPNPTRDPTVPPNTTDPWNTWEIHQYAGDSYPGTSAGINGNVDLDVLSSSSATLQSLQIQGVPGQAPRITITSPSLTFSTSSSFTIAGRVTDSNGVGVGGLDIGADDPISDACLAKIATTDAQGNFQILYGAGVPPGVYPLTLYLSGEPDTFVFSVLPASTVGLQQADNLTLDTGLMGGALTDPFTLSIAPKTGSLALGTALPTQQQLSDAATAIGRFGWSWLSEFGQQFFSDPVNDIAVAGVLTCLIPSGITQATTCPASLAYVEQSLAQTGAVAFANTAVDTWAGDQATKDSLHSLINSGNLLWSVATLDNTAGFLDLTDLGYSLGSSAVEVVQGIGGIQQFLIEGSSLDGSKVTVLSGLVPNPLMATTTAVASSVGPSMLGQSVTFTATVSAGGVTPSGTLTLMDGLSALASAPLIGGTATFTTSALAARSHNITAVYSGNSTLAASTSPVLSQVVKPAGTYVEISDGAHNVVVTPTTITEDGIDSTYSGSQQFSIDTADGTDTLTVQGGPSNVSVTINVDGPRFGMSLIASGSSTINASGNWSNYGGLTVNAIDDAVANLQGAISNWGSTIYLAGAGPINLQGTIQGGMVATTDGTALHGQGGTLDGVTVDADLDVADDGGQLTISNGVTVDGTATLGGSNTLTGAGTLTISPGGQFIWTGGTIASSVTLSLATGSTGTLSGTSGTSPMSLQGTLNNSGAVTYTGTKLYFDAGVFNNLVGGSFTVSGGGGLNWTGFFIAQGAFNNQGILICTGSDTTEVTASFNNSGTVQVQTGGTLNLRGGGSLGGAFAIATTGSVNITAGTFTLQDGASRTGAGILQIAGGTLSMQTGANASVENLTLSSGTLTGAGTLTIPSGGQFTWTGGTIGSTVTLSLAAGSTGTFSGTSGANPMSLQGTLNNGGTIAYTGTKLYFDAGVFNNLVGGNFTVSGGGGLNWTGFFTVPGAFNNQGIFIQMGPGTTSVAVPFNNTGTVEVDNTGVLSLNGTWSTTGVLEPELSTSDQYFITSTVTLAGTLMVDVASGLTPHVGDQFTIIDNQGSGPVQGTFTGLPEGAIIYTAVGPFQISYKGGDGNDVVVTRIAPVTSSFTNLSAPSITFGTTSTTISGQLQANGTKGIVPAGETVEVTLDGVTQNATLNGDDSFSISFATGSLTVAGSPYNSSLSYAGDANFSPATGTSALTVDPAPLTITPNSISKTYGQTINLVDTDFATSGLVNGDTVTSVTLTSAGAGATAIVSSSPYDIVASGAVGTGLGNYAITYAKGQLTVNQAPLTITANSIPSKQYGQTLTFAGTEFTASGLVNGDAVTSVTLTSAGAAATATVAGSPYDIVATGAVGTGLGNYTIAYVKGQLTVSPAPLTISGQLSKTYGQTATFAGTEFTSNGLLNGDTVSSVTLASAGAAATATVGGSPYDIVASGAVGAGLGNYTITYTKGQLTVKPAPLTITANSISKTYGQTINLVDTDFATSGLVNGDTVTSVTLTSAGAGATATVASSPYDIAASGAVGTGLGNYAITYAKGQLTVNQAPLTITANSIPSKQYGQTLTFARTEFTASGLVNGDAVTSLTLTSAGAAATATVSSSPYDIVASSAVGTGLGNYAITYAKGHLTVNQAPVMIIWSDPAPIAYGTRLSGVQLDASASVIVNGSTVPVSGSLVYSPSAGAVVQSGKHSIAVTFIPNDRTDYTISRDTVSLTVDQGPTFSGAQSAVFPVNSAGIFTLTTAGFPRPVLSESVADKLPSGVTFDASTGVLSGTPLTATIGTYRLHFSAQNGIGNSAVETFILTVGQPPSFTSASATTFTAAKHGTFRVAATGFPKPVFTEDSGDTLPRGVRFHAATGLLVGTPAMGTGGTYTLHFSAANGAGTNAMLTFTLTVSQHAVFTSLPRAAFTENAPGTFTVNAGGFPPPTLSESSGDKLPTGITFDAASGTLSGTPALGTSGTYELHFAAHNGVGKDVAQTFILTVSPLSLELSAPAPVAGAYVSRILVATFTDADGTQNLGVYSIQVRWGDGQVSTTGAHDVVAQADANNPGVLDIFASKARPYARPATKLTFSVIVSAHGFVVADSTTIAVVTGAKRA